jgi:hypothetical protein
MAFLGRQDGLDSKGRRRWCALEAKKGWKTESGEGRCTDAFYRPAGHVGEGRGEENGGVRLAEWRGHGVRVSGNDPWPVDAGGRRGSGRRVQYLGGGREIGRWAGPGVGPNRHKERERERLEKIGLAIEFQIWTEQNLPEMHLPELQKFGIKYVVVGRDPRNKFPNWNFSKFTRET